MQREGVPEAALKKLFFACFEGLELLCGVHRPKGPTWPPISMPSGGPDDLGQLGRSLRCGQLEVDFTEFGPLV